MENLLTTTVFSLNPGEVTTLSVHTPQRLQVLEADGVDLWVTRDNDSADYWLRGGGGMLLQRGEELVLSVDPAAARSVRLALIAEARRPGRSRARHLAYRALRRLVRGTQWSPSRDVTSAA